MNSEEMKATETAADNCEVLRARLAKYEDAEGNSLGVVVPDELRTMSEHCEFVMREIGSMDADDVTGDDVDLRFEHEGRDTGCNISIVDYAQKAADVIKALLAAAPKPVDHIPDATKMVDDHSEDVRGMVIHAYNRGYQAGHNDTVEGQFVDVSLSDYRTYHADMVEDLLAPKESGNE